MWPWLWAAIAESFYNLLGDHKVRVLDLVNNSDMKLCYVRCN